MAWKEKHDGYVEIYIKRWKYWKRCDRETKSHQKRFYHERGRSRLLSLTGCGWKLVSGMDWAGEWCGALLDLYSFKHWSPGRHSPRWESCQSWNPEWVAVSKSHNLDLHPPIFHPIRSSSPTLCLKRILPSLMSCWLNSLTFIEIMIMIIILTTKITIINNHNPQLTLLLGSSVYTSSPLGVALDSNLMSSGFVSMSMSTNNRSFSEGRNHELWFFHVSEYQWVFSRLPPLHGTPCQQLLSAFGHSWNQFFVTTGRIFCTFFVKNVISKIFIPGTKRLLHHHPLKWSSHSHKHIYHIIIIKLISIVSSIFTGDKHCLNHICNNHWLALWWNYLSRTWMWKVDVYWNPLPPCLVAMNENESRLMMMMMIVMMSIMLWDLKPPSLVCISLCVIRILCTLFSRLSGQSNQRGIIETVSGLLNEFPCRHGMYLWQNPTILHEVQQKTKNNL